MFRVTLQPRLALPAANSAAFAALDESKIDVKDLFMHRCCHYTVHVYYQRILPFDGHVWNQLNAPEFFLSCAAHDDFHTEYFPVSMALFEATL